VNYFSREKGQYLMASLEKSVFINASPDEIDEVSLDAAGWPEWYPGVEEAVPDDVFPELGGVVEVVYKAGGSTFNLTFTVIEYQPHQSIAYELEGMITGTSRYHYTPEGDGTWLTSNYDYSLPGGILGKIADKMVVERMNAKNLEDSLGNLKDLVEG
jgi:hypothetical protein